MGHIPFQRESSKGIGGGWGRGGGPNPIWTHLNFNSLACAPIQLNLKLKIKILDQTKNAVNVDNPCSTRRKLNHIPYTDRVYCHENMLFYYLTFSIMHNMVKNFGKKEFEICCINIAMKLSLPCLNLQTLFKKLGATII